MLYAHQKTLTQHLQPRTTVNVTGELCALTAGTKLNQSAAESSSCSSKRELLSEEITPPV